jgi:SnoaL-like domain
MGLTRSSLNAKKSNTMNALEVFQRFIDAWNRHDADAVNALYAEGATYHSLRFDHPLKGQVLADYHKSVLTAFPDLRVDVISSGDIGGGLGCQPTDVTRHPHRSVYGRYPAYRSHSRLSAG